MRFRGEGRILSPDDGNWIVPGRDVLRKGGGRVKKERIGRESLLMVTPCPDLAVQTPHDEITTQCVQSGYTTEFEDNHGL
jgi:hypothetical protein